MSHATEKMLIALLATFVFADVSFAQSVPKGVCEIIPNKGGFHRKIAKAFLPPPSRGVRMNAMAIDCQTLAAGESNSQIRPKILFTDLRVISDGGGPPKFPATLNEALDSFEKRYSGQALIGRDDNAVYIAQRAGRLSGATAITVIAGSIHMFNLVEINSGDAVDRSKKKLAEFLAQRPR